MVHKMAFHFPMHLPAFLPELCPIPADRYQREYRIQLNRDEKFLGASKDKSSKELIYYYDKNK
jgi:hypothetical protein